MLILIWLFWSIANLLLTKSYQLAEVSLTTPLKYLSLVFAIIFGFYFFNEIPTIYTLSGAGLIVVSSAIIFIREHQLNKPLTTLPRQQWSAHRFIGIKPREYYQEKILCLEK